MQGKPPAFQKYAQDWLVGTAHLSLEAQGAYERLLCHEWVEGPLPNEPGHLAKLLGVSMRRFTKIWGELARHFRVQGDGTLVNPRLEFERQKQIGYRLVQSLKGQASARARFNRGSTDAQPSGEPKGNLSFSSSSSNLLRKPSTTSSHKGRGGPPESVAHVLEGPTA